MNFKILLISGCLISFVSCAMEHESGQEIDGSLFTYKDATFEAANDEEQFLKETQVLAVCWGLKKRGDDPDALNRSISHFKGLAEALEKVGDNDKQADLLMKLTNDKIRQWEAANTLNNQNKITT